MVWGEGFSGGVRRIPSARRICRHDEALFLADQPVDGDGVPYETFAPYQRDVLRKFHEEPGVRSRNGPPLSPLEPHEWPTTFSCFHAYQRPAALMVLSNRMLAVTEPFRDLVEGLEPDVHQFRALRMLLPGDIEHGVPHYLMVVGQWLSSFLPDFSDPRAVTRDSTGRGWANWNGRARSAAVALSAERVGSAHIWRERMLSRPGLLLSDRLNTAAEAAGLRLPPMYQLKTVPLQ